MSAVLSVGDPWNALGQPLIIVEYHRIHNSLVDQEDQTQIYCVADQKQNVASLLQNVSWHIGFCL